MKNDFLLLTNITKNIALRRVFYAPYDWFWRMAKGNQTKIAPPRGLIFTGYHQFKAAGENYLKYFIDLGGLQPHHRVLDIGCGAGRLAIPLMGYLKKEGSYEGIDIKKQIVNWCQRNISRKSGNFNFRLSDIYNRNYNTKGKLLAKDFEFPFEDDEFDFIFLTSVFMNMMPDEIENYLKQIGKMLKPGGKCFITAFLLNEESIKNLNAAKSAINFNYDFGNYKLHNAITRSFKVAYNEDYLTSLLSKSGMSATTIHHGKWSGKSDGLAFQDIVIGGKPNTI
ncbi:MAG: class I SAM-dependent methyltransferase [Bacteroidetes bacterium]|nr:class I SAM-dependent methyltransferase [Bacteroidota bacterium]